MGKTKTKAAEPIAKKVRDEPQVTNSAPETRSRKTKGESPPAAKGRKPK